MYEYNNEHINNKLQHWAMTHQPSDEMRYKESWWSNICFLRDTILADMYYWPMVAPLNIDFEEKKNKMSDNYDIVGTHRSKSIELPVIKMVYKGAVIVFRYNFYDYEVTVISDKEIKFPDGLFDKNNTTFYYQGFPGEYQVRKSYAESQKVFSVMINTPCSYNFYTFMFILKSQLDNQ